MMKIDAVKMENLMMKRGKTVDDLDLELRRSKGFTRDVLKTGEIGRTSLGYMCEALGISEDELLPECPEQLKLQFETPEQAWMERIETKLDLLLEKLEVTA